MDYTAVLQISQGCLGTNFDAHSYSDNHLDEVLI